MFHVSWIWVHVLLNKIAFYVAKNGTMLRKLEHIKDPIVNLYFWFQNQIFIKGAKEHLLENGIGFYKNIPAQIAFLPL